MKSFSLLLLVASISFIAGAGLTYVAKTPWTSDMANQASIKPQEGPMLPPQGSVATDVIAGTAASSGNTSESEAGHQSMGHQHEMGDAAGHQHDGAAAKHDHAAKGSSKAMDHQHGTSATGHQHGGAAAKHDHAAKSSSQAMGQQHGKSDAAGHKHGGAAAKQDHATKGSSQAMGQQHGTSAAGGHQHDGAAAKQDKGSKSAAPSQTKDSQQKQAGKAQEPSATTSHPLPSDLLGSAGTGPGTTLGSGQSMGATSGDQRKDTSGNEQGSKTLPPAKMKDGHDNHSSNSPNIGGGGSHDQGTSVSSRQKASKMAAHDQHSSNTMPPAKMKDGQDNHSSNPHSHAGGGSHEHGTSASSGQKASKMAAHDHGNAGGSPGKAKHLHQSGTTDKMKAAASPGMHQHGPGASAGGGHAHGDMHSQGQITNPIKPTEASVKKGHQLFNIYCRVCHGAEGRGGTSMESKIPGIPKFTPDLLRSVDDNHMFSMVTSGHGPMPGYVEALTPEERWHVTNYVRTLPNKLAADKKATLRPGASR